MPFCKFVFLFLTSHWLKVKNQRRCIPLGGHASHRAEQEVSRVIKFHSTGNHYFYIYNLFYNNFKGSIPFFTNKKINIDINVYFENDFYKNILKLENVKLWK